MNKHFAESNAATQVRESRRKLITGLSVAGAGALLAGCRKPPAPVAPASQSPAKEEEMPEGAKDESDVTATEDLMREHGVLRRALLVYHEAAIKLRDDSSSVPPEALEKVGQLFRTFGEDYHEKKLEEAFIFPTLQRVQGPATLYVDVLKAQHARGRELTDYILATTAGEKFPSGAVRDFIGALESFVRMYEHHAALEDTIIFPAWKASLKDGELDEMGARFEEIEQQQFGMDGFESAVKRMAEIEESLGLADLGLFTAPAPPHVRGNPK